MDVLQAVVGGSDGCLFSYGHAGLGTLIHESFTTSKARGKLNSVNVRKDFWDRYYGYGKKSASLAAIPETIAGHISAPVPSPLYEQNFFKIFDVVFFSTLYL